MNQGLGFFGWIRDGVKQSVLLGVSDAIESIGTPDTGKELHPAMLSFAKSNDSATSLQRIDSTASKRLPNSSSTGRKRLGKSLRDIEQSKPHP